MTVSRLHQNGATSDVTLRVDGPAASQATAQPYQQTANAAHAASAKATANTTHNEVVHTTDTHPWFTADHGWLPANFLRVGERVVRLDGGTATVVSVRAVPGTAAMWDLTVSQVHTFAVGAGEYVVHNCPEGGTGGATGQDPHKGLPGEDANGFEKRQGAELIQDTPEFKDRYSSDYQWDYQNAAGPDKVGNEIGHEARYTQRYYFQFLDQGSGTIREVSANFDPIAREWEEAAFHMSSGI